MKKQLKDIFKGREITNLNKIYGGEDKATVYCCPDGGQQADVRSGSTTTDVGAPKGTCAK
jgi:hypothetical protein